VPSWGIRYPVVFREARPCYEWEGYDVRLTPPLIVSPRVVIRLGR
jgi:hypothetical protein